MAGTPAERDREREIAAEDSIRVVCRFRPLNDSEERAGSRFVVKFPSGTDDNCISISVSFFFSLFLPVSRRRVVSRKNRYRFLTYRIAHC